MSRRTEDHADLTPAEVTRLIAKFGTELMRDGFIAIPRLLKKRCCEIGITPAQHVFWETVISFQYGEELPFPSIERIADEMGRSERSVKRYIRTMEERGLLRVERSHNPEAGRASNRYDFTGLYEAILALDKHIESDQKGGENTSNIAGNRVNPLKSTTTGDKNVTRPSQSSLQNSSQNGHANGHSMPKMPTELSAEMAVEEDESKEESLQEEDSSNLRSATALDTKGTGLNSRSTPDTGEQQASSKDEKPKSNGSYNNNETKQATKKRNNRNGASDEGAAAAPPACSNVPIQPAGKEEPPYLPTYAANYLDDLSHQFGDMAPKSSQTRAAKIYAKLKPWEGIDEYFFVELITMARDDASKANITKTNPKNGKVNRMPYFLKVLDQLADYNIECWVKEQEGAAGQSKGGGGDQPGGIA